MVTSYTKTDAQAELKALLKKWSSYVDNLPPKALAQIMAIINKITIAVN